MKDYLGIESVKALEVFDSRGNPTLQVEVVTEGGFNRNLHGAIWSVYWKF